MLMHRKGSTDRQIDVFERKLGFRLTGPLYSFFRSELESATPLERDRKLDVPIYELLDARGAQSNWSTMMQLDDWDREWVPIAHDGAGNLHFVHASTGKVGFASQDPYGRKHGKLPLDRWLRQFSMELESFARKVAALPAAKPATKKVSTVGKAWATFDKWLTKNDKTGRFKPSLNGPASEMSIAGAGERLGFELPAELREFYRRHDGQNSHRASFWSDQPVRLLPVAKLTNKRPPGLADAFLVLGAGKDYYKRPWYLAFDKRSGALELYSPKGKKHIPVATSVSAWLDALLEGLAKGKIMLMSDNNFKHW